MEGLLKRYSALLLLTFVSTIALADFNNVCPGGFQPDGYIDFSGLPIAPNFPASALSTPFTVTLPVTGILGLTAQVTIPALQGPAKGVPIYTVSGGTLTLAGQPVASDYAALSLSFNSTVTGLGIVAGTVGNSSSFALQTDVGSSPNFQSSVNNFTGGAVFQHTAPGSGSGNRIQHSGGYRNGRT
jgi:hypothetical protein